MSGELPGFDLDAFRDYYQRVRPGEITGPLRARLIAGGRSNLTYEVTDGGSWWIVRRPPLGNVLATAHDMGREYRVMTALRDTAVPVPVTYAWCEDADVLGAPFYVMQRVDGTPYRKAAELAPLGRDRVAAIAGRMVDTLATLHAVRPADVGLAEFGRPAGFFERQVRRWGRQLAASTTRELRGADELHRLLAENVPPEQPPTIVHGDYRLDNLLVDSSDRVTAVVDWEMATLGDPLTDLALLLIYQRWVELGASGQAVVDVSIASGFPSVDQIRERYTAASGRDVSRLAPYLGLAAYKLAVILEGIHARFLRGQTVGSGFDSVGESVEPLIAEGLRSMKSQN